MEEHANTRSHSSRSILPFSKEEIAHLAPTGKPHKIPSTTAEHPAGERSRSLPKGRAKGDVRHSPVPVATSSSESTINGKREGTIARVQRASPSLIQVVVMSALRSRSAKQKKSKRDRQIAPALGSSAFFVCIVRLVILPLLFA